MKRKNDEVDLDEFLLNTNPEERAKLVEQGLMIESKGERVDRSAMDKSLQQIYKEKVEKLMARVDVPLEDEMREWSEYR
jgi:hypothetical protein